MRAAVLSLCSVLASLGSAPAFAIDDGRGRDWRSLFETMPATGRPTWEQVAAVCPTDGVGACTGKLGNVAMKDWIWATRPQVTDLFSIYVPGIVDSPDGVSGWDIQAAAASFQGKFGITQQVKGCPTYQPCFNALFTTGMTSTVMPGTSPAIAFMGEVMVDLEWGGGGFRFAPTHPDVARGLWMWRPTGLGTDAVHAYDDSGSLTVPGGGIAIADVLANDWVAGQRATLQNVTLTQVTSTVAGVWLDTTTGAVRVADGTTAGTYTFDYRACSVANPNQCDDATVTVTVPTFVLVANPDASSFAIGKGGTAIANVLANDTIGGRPATLAHVTLSQVSTTNPGVVVDAGGAVVVAPGTANGTHVVTYRICERAKPSNCAQTTATVSPNAIYAGNDSARGSSKGANTPIASVLTNDRLGGLPATTSNVTLSQVTAPTNPMIQFDLVTGAVRVLGKASSGVSSFVYRICETASPGNCAQATVTIDLSGK